MVYILYEFLHKYILYSTINLKMKKCLFLIMIIYYYLSYSHKYYYIKTVKFLNILLIKR